MVREAKRRKQLRNSKGKLKIPHSNFINSKKDPMFVGSEYLEQKGTKIKGEGFITISIEQGKRAWAKIKN